jgi:hypothetical protein
MTNMPLELKAGVSKPYHRPSAITFPAHKKLKKACLLRLRKRMAFLLFLGAAFGLILGTFLGLFTGMLQGIFLGFLSGMILGLFLESFGGFMAGCLWESILELASILHDK